ncbi:MULTISPECIES: aminotransferase class I/II-fold pyridoxal phosphate-dependent enzyme [unclassified Lysobacter]|uniref:aminotransferase class I/II-fold pyridoxal phosphate-dependent enzyme n=1 Tax=unclassified Lysobacter TaxID=2635362 RepID=UPI001BEBBC9E|nr:MULTISPECIES: aminotransferase class I/II-fold pyridoxal phosphate-dependent enzyme [unclassified Lysobacter]MBT2746042.1 aminotransferase class I/II-fold pyridoxal phosphate-dependent enzyme [Lysobacter sp. ISL-42]MBT2752477.1 aminotransferase class I/II-fold pyridoxal phosphate-dependent enzyme [Lysobacter sp. ISL-50]MBT2776794.1 aminotransferase class I/II-fold pyridoxal phosphate-dependent enzyme [Lysobacter sp. ISL-54]MBT2780638.1 aminotransferase class I/II-fold pyridoxal phosphate-dep
MSLPPLKTRERLSEVRYEIRGELARRARELEAQGRKQIKLNIGNPGAFGFRAPEHLQRAIADHIADTDPYTHQQGLPVAREAIAAFHKQRGTPNASPERVFVGNGVSELIDLSLRALLNPGDEVLLPSPDYPLWSAATILNDGRPVYYRCQPENGFLPDPDEIEQLVSSRTRAIVLINPNNPTGAAYPRELIERIVAIAAKHKLLLMCDEIYDSILYDGAQFTPVAPIAGDLPCLSFGGLSKVHRACGWRVGWAVLSGDPVASGDFHHAMDLLGALRLCANVPGQFAIEAALNGTDTITPLCEPGGRLFEARRAVIESVQASGHLQLVVPAGALYAFPAVTGAAAHGFDDHKFALELLETEDVLVVPGSSFNVPYRNHFRVTLLPEPAQVREVFGRIERVLDRYAARAQSQRAAVA